ncbi:MAG: diacylglycerol/lipid kinase family protein [Candidatus Heteroscillospira sp.]|jgi:diacylglycerol kinase (ATP)
MKKLMLIVNPNAGKGGYKAGLGEALQIFYSAGYLPSVYFTAAPGDATKLAIDHARGYDLIVCMGGDGTLSETTAGLAQLTDAPELGYIPMGTANDVAASLGLSKNPAEAAQTVVTGRGMDMDLGLFNDNRYFTYIAAFGAFTDVSYITPQQSKQALGHFAYVLEGMKALPKLPTTHAVVEYDGGTIDGDFIFGGVTNSTSLAGLIRLDSSLVELGDGLFEVILVRTPKNIIDLQTAFSEFVNKDYSGTQITILHSSSIRFRFPEPMAWTRDGENGGEHSEVCLKNLRHAVKIRVSPGRFFANE